ncbi:MAG: 2-dehydropantoate 2-reductase [Rhodospirillales bacterium]|nr:2-dehydropantoate 2-reductase [Rhodospirillales bacterium]
MRLLVLGAGGIGGYFGARLAAAGADVTFLVRPRRAGQLAAHGLVVQSALGDVTVPVRTVSRDAPGSGYGAILLSCKAYDLDDAIAALAPAAGGALIVPLLNGMAHLERLDAAFGQDRVAGGVAVIGVTMEPDGTIRHLNRAQTLIHGARTPTQRPAVAALQEAMAPSGIEARASETIIHDMWEKWVFLCSIAAMTCLMRSPVGPIASSPQGEALMLAMRDECSAAAAAAGFAPREAHREFTRRQLTDKASTMAASMMRDLDQGLEVEADHVVGDMLARARAAGHPAPLLAAAYTHLDVYRRRRATANQG